MCSQYLSFGRSPNADRFGRTGTSGRNSSNLAANDSATSIFVALAFPTSRSRATLGSISATRIPSSFARAMKDDLKHRASRHRDREQFLDRNEMGIVLGDVPEHDPLRLSDDVVGSLAVSGVHNRSICRRIQRSFDPLALAPGP